MTFKAGDKVKGYDHAYNWAKDGWEGKYVGPSDDIPGAHVVIVDDQGYVTYRKVVPVDTRSELDVYKQNVLLPAVWAAQKEHSLCDAGVEEFLKAVGVEQVLPELPTGKNALVEDKDQNVWRRSNNPSGPDVWYFTTVNAFRTPPGASKTTKELAKIYKRTIFEGE